MESSTGYRELSAVDAMVIVKNNQRHLTIGGKTAVINYDSDADLATGKHRRVALDFPDNTVGLLPASADARQIICRVFGDVI